MKSLFNLRGNNKRRSTLMFVAFLSLFVLSAIFFTACDKGSPVAVDQTSPDKDFAKGAAEQTMNPETARFSVNGKLYESAEFHRTFKSQEFPILVAGNGLSEENVIYAFPSEDAFGAWAKTTPFADKFAKLGNAIAEAKQQQLSKGDSGSGIETAGGYAILWTGYSAAGSGYRYNAPRLQSALSSGINNFASSVQIFNPSNTYRESTACALFDLTGYGGRYLVLTNTLQGVLYTWPNLGAFGFDNRASALIVI